ncbi:CehA/McbA family metallohydrolase [Sporomusa malonica]|uniref:Carboxypeptidase regulatory-like domain-containing protein n=1 Tax=Sporomusa malonica TaxID=112901 RepID=A0A1W2EW33_9FIRM|nr:CehA/McbA family metallohydrolase [Sporomusa malonica]SMD13911.1 Carboxypeptidase regulatory-like domain-containing protein [Sporomusa malonica]
MNLKTKMSALLSVCALCLILLATPAMAEVGVVNGPTPIDQGMAIHKDDFTIYNDKIAASFAVGTNNYWNMTNGSILDVAVMKDGKFGVDLVNDIEFLNDLWTATGAFNNEILLKVPAQDITYKKDDNKVIVTAKTRYWTAGHKLPLNVTIEYILEDGKNYIGLKTTVENPDGNHPYENVYSGYSISTLAASMFGPYGYYPDKKTTGIRIGADKEVNEKFGNFVVTYGKDYAVSVQLVGADSYKGSSGYKDVYTNRTIEPGKTYVYTGEILVLDKGETTPIIERFLEKETIIQSATVKGTVTDSVGNYVKNAYVIVNKKGTYKETKKSHGADAIKKDIMQPFVWEITDEKGNFEFKLPKDEYQIYAEAKGCTPSEVQAVNLTADSNVNFAVKEGAKAVITALNEKSEPIDFKIQVSGVKSSVKSLGGTVFFSNPKTHKAEFDVAAPETPVTFTATFGSGYESHPVEFTTTIKPGETFTHKFIIPTLIDTASKKWYCADNHQHSDKGDGATPIGELYKAQVAAKLDFNVVSDHDLVSNNAQMAALVKAGNRPFISSLEVSPGWGHWGILGMDYTKEPISPNGTPAEIIKAGHDMGALVVVNHPYSDYGFFRNRDGVKGGFDKGSEDFDLIELQSTINLKDAKNMDKLALDDAMGYWNKGIKKYLSAGSDQHDVTSGLYPGIIRMYAHMDGNVTTKKYLKALKEGHAYVTMGPIFTPAPNTMFGSTQKVKAGSQYTLNTEIQAVNGLTRIDVYCEGKVIESKEFNDTKDVVKYMLNVKPTKSTWYSFVAVDRKGLYAVTNPIWVNVTGAPRTTM